MKKVNISIIFIIIFQILTTNSLSAKFTMASLERAKKKAEKAISETYKKTKNSIKDFFKEKKEEEQEKEDPKSNLAKSIIPVGNSVIAGIDLYKYSLEKMLKQINNNLTSYIYWGIQSDLIQELDQTNSIYHKAGILSSNISRKYTNSKTPLINFASDLSKEMNLIEEQVNNLKDFIINKNKIKDPKDVQELESTIQTLHIIDTNLQKIAEISNQLLLK